jgi:DNA polymerase elongation subunit (family B)
LHNLNPLRYASLSSYSKNGSLLSLVDTDLYTLAPAVDEYIRAGYHGGRTETIQPGEHEGQMQLLDFNSHYPEMMTQDLPHGKPRTVTEDVCSRITSDNMIQWLQQHRGFYSIHVLYEPQHIKHHLFGSVDGYGRYTFTDATNQIYQAEESDTIIYAIEIGYVIRLLHGYSFKYSPYMKPWIEKIYEDKVNATLAGDKIMRHITKLVLNSAYGAFGTKWKERKQQVTYGAQHIRQIQHNEILGYSSGTVHHDIWCGTETTNLLLNDINVAISSCVTSRARLKLYQTMMYMEAHDTKVLYVDTDSLIVQPKDPDTLTPHVHPTALGALKLEAQLDKLTLVGNKMYSYTDTDRNVISKLKGLKLSQCITPLHIPEVLSNSLKHISTTVHVTKLFHPKHLFFSHTPIISKLLSYTIACK